MLLDFTDDTFWVKVPILTLACVLTGMSSSSSLPRAQCPAMGRRVVVVVKRLKHF